MSDTKGLSPGGQGVHQDLEFYRFVIQSLPVCVVTVDSALIVTSINPCAQDLLGYESHEVVGRHCGEVLRGEMCRTQCPLKTVLENRSPIVQIETTVQKQDGERVPVRMQTAGLFDHAGNLLGGLEAFLDLSHVKALEREKHNFISMLAHDMKSPLISIDGFAFRLLKRVMGDETLSRYVNVIREEARKLESLIDDFLEFARLQTGRLSLNFSATSLNRELQELFEIYRPHAAEKGVDLLLEVGEEFPTIRADTARLHRALRNLLDNAIKYSEQGGKVTISTFSAEDSVGVEIRDEGLGIDPTDLPHIFVPFHRGRRGDERKGSGIGLASVKAIVEGHGGEVIVESECGAGSCFTVVLRKRSTQEGGSG